MDGGAASTPGGGGGMDWPEDGRKMDAGDSPFIVGGGGNGGKPRTEPKDGSGGIVGKLNTFIYITYQK
jgi:hypothetical protein